MATRTFHHIGLRTFDEQPDENFVVASRVWVTDPNSHPNKIEWLRYEPDSWLSEEFKNSPHVAYVVDELEPWLEGKDIAIEPFEVGDPAFVRVAFVWEDGWVAEYMAFKPGVAWFSADDQGTARAVVGETK